MRLIFGLVLLFLFLGACSADSKITSNVFDVSKYSVTLNGKPAAYIKYGDSEENHCMLAVTKASLVEGYEKNIVGSPELNAEVDLTCMKDGFFALSLGDDTFLNVSVEDLSKNSVTYKITATLINVSNGSYFDIKDELVLIDQQNWIDLARVE